MVAVPSGRNQDRVSSDAALRLACYNGGLWALGNGLVRTTLITYLARELGAQGLAVGLILACPNLFGVLRLGAPALLRLVGDRKRFCLAAFTLSSLLLLALPRLAAPGVLPRLEWSLAALVALWAAWHLVLYVGMIAFWSWLGDLAPPAARGAFVGRRERWLVVGTIVGAVAAGLYAWQATQDLPREAWWRVYAQLAQAGALCMLASVLPVLAMPAVPLGKVPPEERWLLGGLGDARFRWFLAFACWTGLANGVSQSAQGLYPILVLKLHVLWMLLLEAGMRAGQAVVAEPLGRWADRHGNRGLMIAGQLLVSVALGFYLLATPEQPWWLAGAWTLWIAYAALNVGLPNLLLKLSPGHNSPPYITLYFALSGLAYGVSSAAGGWVFDALGKDWRLPLPLAGSVDRFQIAFLLGAALRALAIVWLLWLPEPKQEDRGRLMEDG